MTANGADIGLDDTERMVVMIIKSKNIQLIN
jgi:hypothetical protein